MEQQRTVRNEVAEVELIYKSTVKPSERLKVSNSQDVYDVFLANWDKNKIEFVEQLKVMFLNRANRVMGIYELSTGCGNATIADPKLVFTSALLMNAQCIVLAHNHPSASTKPSKADEQLTEKIKNAGLFLDLRLLDHLIITSADYFSFADNGLL